MQTKTTKEHKRELYLYHKNRNLEMRRIGGWFLSHFPAKVTREQAGKIMDTSATTIENIEKLAAYKIVKGMQKLLGKEKELYGD